MGSEDPQGSFCPRTGTWCCLRSLRSCVALAEGEWQASGYTVSVLSFNMHSSFSERKDPISMNNVKKASYWPGSTAVAERCAGAKAPGQLRGLDTPLSSHPDRYRVKGILPPHSVPQLEKPSQVAGWLWGAERMLRQHSVQCCSQAISLTDQGPQTDYLNPCPSDISCVKQDYSMTFFMGYSKH